MDAHIAAVAEARIGNVNHLSKPATLDYSCFSIISESGPHGIGQTVGVKDKSSGNIKAEKLNLPVPI